MKISKFRSSIIITLLVLVPITSYGHPGRTDGNGGHKDNKNASGLGSYHYHCGDNPAHLHTNECPYGNGGTSGDIGGTTNDWESSWAKDSIKDFIEKEYIKGYPDGSFKPTKSINRSEFVTIFNRVFGLTTKNGKIFNDTKNHWAKDSIDIAVTNGVAKGVSETEFAPDSPITREQAAKMVANYKKISDTNYDKLNGYSDGANVSSWAKSEVEAILEKGYMNGYLDGSFKPKGEITRAEAVVTLDRSK